MDKPYIATALVRNKRHYPTSDQGMVPPQGKFEPNVRINLLFSAFFFNLGLAFWPPTLFDAEV